MRTRTVRLGLAVLMMLALSASVAAALPVYPRPATSPATPAIPAGVVVVKTAASLPGATYRWVQPRWIKVGGGTLVTVPTVAASRWVQPPVWIPIR